jgi:DNA-binding response OmpR family regulator
MAKLLLVDDDKKLLGLLTDWLTHQDFTVEAVESGKEATFRLNTFQYDLVVLDWELPDTTGIDICRDFREKGGHTPILMLTGRDQMPDKLKGLDTGADDYLAKPCDLEELSARVRALLRRPKAMQPKVLNIGAFEIDLNAHTVKRNGKQIDLQPREFELFAFLVQHESEIFNAEAIMTRLWSSESESSPDVIRVHVAKLRSKLGNPNLIKTVHGLGYKFDAAAASN